MPNGQPGKRTLDLGAQMLPMILVITAISSLAAGQSGPPAPPADPFFPVETLGDLPPSGDTYPSTMCAPTEKTKTAFEGKNVVFVFSHGVEDHEVYYQFQYFANRGAKITFACPSESVPGADGCILSDFIKPTYSVEFVNASSLDLTKFDAVFIPGGQPSSADLRRDPTFPRQLAAFWNSPTSAGKLLAFICSGTEVMIESGILASLPKDFAITGSPASQWPLRNALAKLGRDPSLFMGTNPQSQFDVLSYPGDGKTRPNLVLGRDPTASPRFVAALGDVWMQLHESWNSTEQEKLNLNADGKFVNKQFQILPDSAKISSLPQPPPINPPAPPKAGQKRLEGKNVAIVTAPGMDGEQAHYLFTYFANMGAYVKVACPSWVIQWKSSTLFTMTTPPSAPSKLVKCDIGFDVLQDIFNADTIIVPGGVFASHGVLRNDADFMECISNVTRSSPDFDVLGIMGSSADVLISQFHASSIAGLQDPVPVNGYTEPDLSNDARFKLVKDSAWRDFHHTNTVTTAIQGQKSKLVISRSPYEDRSTGKSGLEQFAEAIAEHIVTSS